jgi:hypothetical protein
MDALREGHEPPPPDRTALAVRKAAMYEGDVFRGMLEMLMCLALPAEVLARRGFRDKLDAHADEPDPVFPGPSRSDLIEMLD